MIPGDELNMSKSWLAKQAPDVEDRTSDSLTFQSVVENQCHRVPLSEVDFSYK